MFSFFIKPNPNARHTHSYIAIDYKTVPGADRERHKVKERVYVTRVKCIECGDIKYVDR